MALNAFLRVHDTKRKVAILGGATQQGREGLSMLTSAKHEISAPPDSQWPPLAPRHGLYAVTKSVDRASPQLYGAMIASTPLEAYPDALALNLLSVVAMCQAAVPAMQERRWGRVVAITSMSVKQPIGTLILSNTARAGATGFLKTLATEVAADGVTVNSVLPGPTLSEGVAEMLRPTTQRTGQSVAAAAADFVRAHRPSSILQRAATAEEVAHTIVYACSPQASATTGAALRVDGGVVKSAF